VRRVGVRKHPLAGLPVSDRVRYYYPIPYPIPIPYIQLLLVLSQVDAILGMIWLAATNPDMGWKVRICDMHTATGAVVSHADNLG